MIMKRLLILFFFFSGMVLQAQHGVRFTVLDFEVLTRKWSTNLLVGYDHDLNDRLALGIDVVKSIRFDPDLQSNEATNGDIYSYYTLGTKNWGLQYRSLYFFSGSGYLASTVGVRSLTMELNGYTMDNSNYNYEQTNFKESTSATIFPLGLRLGFRSELDGYYGDIYVGIGTVLGNKDVLKNTAYIDKKEGITSLWINAGYVLGIGW
jgi:hypothetical protein